ncbi:MAG: FHA domain-containing protein [Planctomycetales bacterium]|nr:FHA domain-containing protein [Planctomycetales bacterium]
MARLILRMEGQERPFPLEASEVSIGRSDENQIRITDIKSSRKHCVVKREGAGYLLQDLDSSNGTQVNGAKVKTQMLRDGDVIQIGLTTITFKAEGEEAAAIAVAAGAAPVTAPAPESAAAGAPDRPRYLLLPGEPTGGSQIPIPIVGTITIGRAPGNTIVLSDTKASGKHCEVLVRDGVPILRDVGSTNGTRVDGARVTETPLRQGARIEIGTTLYFFKDTQLPDAPAESVLESGVLGEDFAAASAQLVGRGIQGAVLALLLFAGAIGGTFLLVERLGETTGSRIESPADNRLVRNYSFEEGGSGDGAPLGWIARAEGEDSVRADRRSGGSGRYQLVLERRAGTRPDRPTECVYAEDLPVPPGKAFRVRAKLRAEGLRGVAGLRARWLPATGAGPEVDSWGPLATESGPPESAEAVLVPPPTGAAKVRFSAALLGAEGRAVLDDLEAYEVPVPSGDAATVGGARLRLSAGPRGRLALSTEEGGRRDVVFHSSEVVASGTSKAAARGRQEVSRVEGGGAHREGPEGGALVAAGELYEAGEDRWIPFRIEARPADGGRIRVALEAGREGGPPLRSVGLTLLLAPLRVRQGVGLLTGEGYAAPGPAFDRVSATQVFLGSTHDLVGVRSAGGTPFVASLAAEGGVPRLTLAAVAPVEAGAGGASRLSLVLEWQADFGADRDAATALLRRAAEAEKAGKLGESLATFDRVATEYAFERSAATRAEEARARLRAAGAAEIAALRRAQDESLFPQPSVTKLDSARRRAGEVAGRFEGSPFGEDAKAIRLKLEGDAREARIADGQVRAESLLRRGRDYAKIRWTTLARQLLEKVERDFPGTDWAKDAQTALAGLPKEGE